MPEEHAKTEIDQVEDALAQLKEMHHYSRSNVETLSTQWILFDGDLAKLKKSEMFGALMDRQGQLHDALEAAIGDLEKTLEKMQPEEPDENADAPNRGRPHHGLDDSAETGPGQPVNPQRTNIPARHESSFQTGGSGETKAQHIKDRNVADEESEAQRKARADSAPGAPIHPDGKD